MAHEPETVLLVLKRVDRSKHLMLAAIAALFLAILFFFAFSLAHSRAAEGNAKLLFGVTAAQMAFVGGCAVLVSYHVSRMTRTVLQAIDLASKK
jgi:hypothetical protein